jgi:hypothetical protein
LRLNQQFGNQVSVRCRHAASVEQLLTEGSEFNGINFRHGLLYRFRTGK